MGSPTRSHEPEQAAPGIWQVRTEPWGPAAPLYLRLVRGTRSAALIDSGLRSTWSRVLALIDAVGLRPQDVRLLLNTHPHFDHVGANAAARTATGCLVAAPAGAVPWIEDPAQQYREFCLRFPKIIPDSPALRAEVYEELDAGVPVDACPADGSLVRLGGLELEALELPGHAAAELGYFERAARTLLVGDAVTSFAWPAFQGHVAPAAYRRTLARLRAFAAKRRVELVLLAHHPPLPAAELVRLLDAAAAHLDALDTLLFEAVCAAAAPLALRDTWQLVLVRTGKAADFRGLTMVAGHLDELVARGKLVRTTDGRYAGTDRDTP